MFKLRGVVPPMITPFDHQGNLDLDNLEKLLLFLKDKVDGVYICGSYGSGPMMNVDERKQVAEMAIKVLDGKIRVVAHTGATNTRDTVELTRHAEAIGCDAAAAATSGAGPTWRGRRNGRQEGRPERPVSLRFGQEVQALLWRVATAVRWW